MRVRFEDAEWFQAVNNLYIGIVGLGGIGSWAAFALGRLQPSRLILVDGDSFENHNQGSQLINEKNMGSSKANALSNIIYEFLPNSGINIRTSNRMLTEDNYSTCFSYGDPTVMVVGTDSIESRELAFRKFAINCGTDIKQLDIVFTPRKRLFIDARMTAEFFEVYAVPMDDKAAIMAYVTTLFDPSETQPLPCGFQQTSHVAMMLGGYIGGLVVNFVEQKRLEICMRPVPFKTTFNAQSLAMAKFTSDDVYRSNIKEVLYGYEPSGVEDL